MTTSEILAAFPALRALVIGDICLDRWCTYDPGTSEPSRETHIPRLGVVSTAVTPGAGGTVANNLATLGAGTVAVLGVRGDDGFGFELDQALVARGIRSERMVKVQGWQTFTYTKLLNGQTGIEDQPRVDFISTRPLPEETEREIIDKIVSAIADFDIVLISDQAETERGGVITPAVRASLIDAAGRYPEKVFLADSRKRLHLFRNVMLKSNHEEAEAASHRLLGNIDFAALRQRLGAKVLMVTHGSKGVFVVEERRQTRVQTHAVENPVDICGAGDSFAAGCALTLAATHDPLTAARFGNLVASVTIMKKGTGTASPEEVRTAAEVRAFGLDQIK